MSFWLTVMLPTLCCRVLRPFCGSTLFINCQCFVVNVWSISTIKPNSFDKWERRIFVFIKSHSSKINDLWCFLLTVHCTTVQRCRARYLFKLVFLFPQKDPGAALIFPNSTEVRFKLGGIASYGTGEQSCSLRRPGVYTRIAQFVDWISQVTDIKFWKYVNKYNKNLSTNFFCSKQFFHKIAYYEKRPTQL